MAYIKSKGGEPIQQIRVQSYQWICGANHYNVRLSGLTQLKYHIWQSEYFSDLWEVTCFLRDCYYQRIVFRMGDLDCSLGPPPTVLTPGDIFGNLFHQNEHVEMLMRPLDKPRPLYINESFRAYRRWNLAEKESLSRQCKWIAGKISYQCMLDDVDFEEVLNNMSWLSVRLAIENKSNDHV